MQVAARPRIPDSAALTSARWAESVPGLDRWPRGARGGDDHGRKAARATRQQFECECQPKPENEVWGAIRLAAVRGRVRLLLWVSRGRKPLGYERSTGSVTGTLAPLKSK